MLKIFLLAFLFILLFSCNSVEKELLAVDINDHRNEVTAFKNENTAVFYEILKSFCGKSFEGREVYVKQGRESWAKDKLRIFFTRCDDEQLHIPLHVGSDKSRTWMFINENGYLRFSHDHRQEDGTPEKITLYGGYASERSTAYHHIFPADGYTIGMHLSSEGSRWEIILADNLSTFCYKLFHYDELLFHGSFNLEFERPFEIDKEVI